MVPSSSIVFMVISGIISCGLPVLAFLIINKRIKLDIIPLLVGCAAFFVFALILESGLHALVLKPGPDGSIALISKNPILYILYGIFAAGIFEETARFLSFSLLKKKHHGINTAISYGIGHGGIECIMLVGLAMASNIVIAIMINTGSIGLLGNMVPTELLVDPLVDTAPAMFLVAGVERIFAFTFHIALSIIVWTAVNYRGMKWLYPVAICMHAVFNIPAAAMQAGLIESLVLVEVLCALGAIVSIAIAIFITKKMKTVSEDTKNSVAVMHQD